MHTVFFAVCSRPGRLPQLLLLCILPYVRTPELLRTGTPYIQGVAVWLWEIQQHTLRTRKINMPIPYSVGR